MIFALYLPMDKRYIKWSAKEINSQYWPFLSVSINKEDFNTLPVDKSGYVRLTINKKKATDQYGNTHSIVLNEREPKGGEKETVIGSDDLDLPFG